MPQRLPNPLIKILIGATLEAHRHHHEYIGTEHLLLALIEDESGPAAVVLKKFNVTARKVRDEADKIIVRGPTVVTMRRLPQTPRAKIALTLAQKEAESFGHEIAGPQHLLLGLMRESEGVAAVVLQNLGLKYDDVRAQVFALSADEPTPDNPPSRTRYVASIFLTEIFMELPWGVLVGTLAGLAAWSWPCGLLGAALYAGFNAARRTWWVLGLGA